MTLTVKRIESHADNLRLQTFAEFTGKVGRLDHFRHRPRIRLLIASSRQWRAAQYADEQNECRNRKNASHTASLRNSWTEHLKAHQSAPDSVTTVTRVCERRHRTGVHQFAIITSGPFGGVKIRFTGETLTVATLPARNGTTELWRRLGRKN